MLTRKTAQNFQAKKPSLGRKKQGPFFRKRVIVKHETKEVLFAEERKKAGSARLKYKMTKREGKASMKGSRLLT